MVFQIKDKISRLLKNNRQFCTAIFVLAFLIRLGYVLTMEDKWYFYDTVHYDKAAQHLLDGEGFGKGYYFDKLWKYINEYSLEPAYPVFLAGVYGVFGHSLLAVRIVQSLVGALICIVVFLIANRIFNRKVAQLSSLICAVYPLQIFISGMLYIEVVFTLFVALAVHFALKMGDERHSLLYAILSGAFLGLAMLGKSIVLAFVPFLALWTLLARVRNFKSTVLHLSLVFFALALTLTPWTIRNYNVFGKFSLVRASTGNQTVYVAKKIAEYEGKAAADSSGQSAVAESKEEAVKTGGLVGLFLKHPVGFSRHYVGEFIHFWALYPDRVITSNEYTDWKVKFINILSFGPLLLFFLIGIYVSRKEWRMASLPFFAVLSFAMAYSLFHTQIRYRVPVEPYMFIIAANGFLGILMKFKKPAPTDSINNDAAVLQQD